MLTCPVPHLPTTNMTEGTIDQTKTTKLTKHLLIYNKKCFYFYLSSHELGFNKHTKEKNMSLSKGSSLKETKHAPPPLSPPTDQGFDETKEKHRSSDRRSNDLYRESWSSRGPRLLGQRRKTSVDKAFWARFEHV